MWMSFSLWSQTEFIHRRKQKLWLFLPNALKLHLRHFQLAWERIWTFQNWHFTNRLKEYSMVNISTQSKQNSKMWFYLILQEIHKKAQNIWNGMIRIPNTYQKRKSWGKSETLYLSICRRWHVLLTLASYFTDTQEMLSIFDKYPIWIDRTAYIKRHKCDRYFDVPKMYNVCLFMTAHEYITHIHTHTHICKEVMCSCDVNSKPWQIMGVKTCYSYFILASYYLIRALQRSTNTLWRLVCKFYGHL